MITSGRLLYLTFLGKNPVVVITSPADAKIKLNGKELGKAPLTVELRTGQYILEAEKTNYETVQHGIYVSAKASNVVNIQMISTASAAAAIAATQTNGSQLEIDVGKLKEAMISDPEEALSLPLIREKIRVQEEMSKAFRDELKEVKEQNRWYLGAIIAVVIGLLTIIASLFVGQHSSRKTMFLDH